ncbi:MAG: GNAT family N-acetyltransferase, partial [Promethearchaeota archaeon]
KYEDFRQYILFLLNQWKLNQDLTYTIQLNSEYDKNRDHNPNHTIGQISLYNISFQHHRGEVGIWIGKKYWNHGYASEALQTIVKFAFDELHMNRLQAHIFITNPSSKHIFEKIGFIKEGLNREYVSKQGTFLDVEHYALLYSDWINK